MANIRIDIDGILMDGHEVSFKAPCDCAAIDGIKVYYIENGTQKSKVFALKDTHGNTLTGIGNLFTKDAVVKVILDIVKNAAYIQNADTNAYLEGKLKEKATLGDANAYFAGILLGNTPNVNAYIYNDGNDGILFKFADLNGQAQYVNIIDLLNNIHTTNAAYTMAQTKLSNQMTTLANGTDMNSITDIGFYTGSELVNAPVGGWVVFIHMRVNNDPNYCIQILVSNGYTKMFFRLQNGGNWENWYELSRTMDLSNYLPLSGGATTGKVLCNSCSKTNAVEEAYAAGAFEIREVDQVGASQTDMAYAPKLGFHWAGTAGAAIALGSDGRFYSLSTNFGQNIMLDSSMFTVSGDDLILEWL